MAVYYNGLIAWSFNFFLFSFQSKLPWAIDESTKVGNQNYWNEEYFKKDFLHMSEGLFDIDHHVPWIILSFVIVTVITFITEYKSLSTAQFAVWIFIPSAYFILIILFFKGIMLKGCTIGWTYLFRPQWEKIFTLQIWRDAVSQSIFSAGLGIHAVILFASHKTRGEAILIPSLGVPILNFWTSIFAAITLFSFVGHASYKTNIPIEQMPIDGLELAFVAYPALLSTFPFPQIWSALFFLMLVFIGLSTQFAFVDVTWTFIHGIFFRFGCLNVSKTLLIFIFCALILVIDIVLIASNAGYHWIDFFDHYVVGINLVVSLTIQLIIFGHYLPIEDIEDRVESMGEKFPKIYKFLLKYVTPVVCGSLAVVGLINEIVNPPDLPLLGKILALALFLLPNLLWLGFFILDPWHPEKWDWQKENTIILQSAEKS
jgi:solute carrier family 6 (neurotransmitter transporter, taurine) member 6